MDKKEQASLDAMAKQAAQIAAEAPMRKEMEARAVASQQALADYNRAIGVKPEITAQDEVVVTNTIVLYENSTEAPPAIPVEDVKFTPAEVPELPEAPLPEPPITEEIPDGEA